MRILMIYPKLLTVISILLLLGGNVSAETDKAGSPSGLYFTGDRYNLNIPGPSGYLGFPLGSKPVSHSQLSEYIKILANSSDRVQLFRYGQSYEGHDLYYLVITSKENMTKIDGIKASHYKLADPRVLKPGQEIDKLIDQLPAIVWAGYSIHGDELSSTDAAVAVAYQLAAGIDTETQYILDNLVLILDPLQNPDGRERMLTQIRQFAGKVNNPDIQNIQHTGVWPWGRGNHYLIDLNRDMFTQIHPETRGKIGVCLDWHPQVMIDAHEMGSLSTYLFSPAREPFNPHWSKNILKWWDAFASDQADAFNNYGWSYYTRAWHEEWFPGYTSAWGIYLGMVGILYEQAGVNGHLVKRRDGSTLIFSETVHHHLVSTLANLNTAAENRRKILDDYYNEKVRALANDDNSIGQAFLVEPSQNPHRVIRFIRMLIEQGIEVKKADKEFTAHDLKDCREDNISGKKFPAGTFVVEFAQPSRLLAQVLLDFDIRMDSNFLHDERRSIEKGWGSKMYEISAWSMPLAFGLESYIAKSKFGADLSFVSEVEAKTGMLSDPNQAFGFMIDYVNDATTYLLAESFENALKPKVAMKPVTIDGKSFGRGSILFIKRENPDNLIDILSELAEKHRVNIHGINTALATAGSDLGGGDFRMLEQPRIAMLTGNPIDFQAYGNLWHMLDYDYSLRVTSIDISRLGRTDLSKYNVLIIPPTWGGANSYKASIGKNGLNKLKTWMTQGGSLIAIGPASAYCADTANGLSQVRLKHQALKQLDEYEYALKREKAADEIVIDSLLIWDGPKPKPKADKKKKAKLDLKQLKRDDEFARKFNPRGVIFDCGIDTTTWLSFGLDNELPVLMATNSAFLAKPPVTTVARLKSEADLRLAGLVWPETRTRWANTAYCTRESNGRGQLILFASNPNLRSYFHGSKRLLVNAILLGPGLGSRLSVPY
ncbi:MAG: hypothetical protein GY839_18155 [candidate division Zixibacteria bacterium]|nr:hypothetical protein [candidate division Zixibacteria bacterium]